MKFTNLTANLSKVAGRSSLVLKKYSPEILLVVGITGFVASSVMACRATLEVEDVMKTHQDKVEMINKAWTKVEAGEISLDDYTEKAKQKDLTVTYVQTGVDFVKLYGPSVLLATASIACIVGGHGVMKKRNVALVAAYKAVEEGFNEYRKRVVAEHGEDVDYMYKNNLRAETVTETEVGEDGKTKKVKKTVMVPNGDTNGISVYARFFDEGCAQWSKTPEYNLMFLNAQQKYFNNLLQARGHVFLNDVYDALGIPRSKAGAVVGWVMRSDGEGDNFIDFGMYNGDRETIRDFVNGNERNILLDFNVDGVIYDLI